MSYHNRANGNRGYQNRNAAPQFNVEAEKQAFLAYLTEPANRADYAKLLGPDVDIDRFISSAIDAVSQKPDLLNPDPGFRQSLFFSLKKAAKQGLEPDGVQGALIPRYSTEAKCKLVQWQPMVKGVQLAAKRIGIKKIHAEFVLAGEPFRYLSGDEERIEHEWDPKVRDRAYSLLRQIKQSEPDPNAPPDEGGGTAIVRDIEAFWEMLVAGYCIITMPDNTKVRRAMPRTRLLLLRDASKAGGGSPWFGPFFDEMIVKGLIHFGMKRVPLESMDPEMLAKIQAFRDAVDQDMDADLDDESGPVLEHQQAPPTAALPAPSPALSNLADKLAERQTQQVMDAGEREAVTTSSQDTRPEQAQQKQQQPTTQEQPRQQPSQEESAQAREAKVARAAAEKFARGLKEDLMMTTGSDAFADVISNKAMLTRLERLKTSYADVYKDIVKWCATTEGVLAKVGGELQTRVPWFYDDIIGESTSQAA